MNKVLETSGLDVGYKNKAVIKGVNLDALPGQVICLIGPNGAGKSTILRTLAGFLAPVSGTVYVTGEDLSGIKAAERSRKMAVVLTEQTASPLTSAYEIVSAGRSPYTGFFGRLSSSDHAAVREALETVGASRLADREFSSLSDGERQKIMIARALAQKPQLLILDEPTSHLDIAAKVELVCIINRLARQDGLTVVLAMHEVDIAVKACTLVLLVKDGRILASGLPEDVAGGESVDDLYDLRSARYSPALGSVEVVNSLPPSVFIAAGAGTGAPLYRILSREGIGIATGVLAENDIDCAVADAIGLSVVREGSFRPVGGESIGKAGRLLDACRLAVDAGFPVAGGNEGNIGLLDGYAARGGRVLSLRLPEETARLYENAQAVQAVGGNPDLVKAVREILGENVPAAGGEEAQ